MKKKLILLVGLIFIVTGCTAEYELTYEDGVFSEHVVITERVESNSNDLISISSITGDSHYLKIDGKNKYEYDLEKSNTKNVLTLDFVYKDISYEKSKIYNNCFKYRTFIDEDDYYYIKLEGDSVCDYLSSADITFKTDKLVYKINADEQDEENGIYKWNEFKGGEIIIQVSKTETVASRNAELNKEFIPWYVKLIVSGVVVVGVVIVIQKIKRDQV